MQPEPESEAKPKQSDGFWEQPEMQGVMPQAQYTIAGEVQAAQQIPLGATHFAMFPQTNAVFVAAILAEACVIGIFVGIEDFPYLWLNLIGCALVILFSFIFIRSDRPKAIA